jgi:serine/threonine-protein kinase HipA
MNTDALVKLWGREIGAVTWSDERETAVFQYIPEFLHSRIELSPLMMPLAEFPYSFPALSKVSFHGLPGLLADSLPDKWGNAVMNAWLDTQQRDRESVNPVERLCYIGSRGMGALEFKPALLAESTKSKKVNVESLVLLANQILQVRGDVAGQLTGTDDTDALENILCVGTSAGGARAKAILAWNPESGQFRSGQMPAASGYTFWIMKFDGISNNRDKEIADPQGFGKIEYAYYLMAKGAGITMMPCRLHHEGGRSHFMTKRFDRKDNGDKLHMQTLGAMAHFDFNQAAAHSYEQAIQIMRRLNLPQEDIKQQVLRAFFNVVARNQDDHVKNISFVMNQAGTWRLSPAYDLTYSYHPNGTWTVRHQMSMNGKRDDFVSDDLLSFAETCGLKKAHAKEIFSKVRNTVEQWEMFAEQAGVNEEDVQKIKNGQRLHLKI